MNRDPSPGPAGSAAGLAARVALALERHHDLAADVESAGKRIDRLLERIDFGLLGIERSELVCMPGQDFGAAQAKFAFYALDIGARQLIPHVGNSFQLIG